MRKLFSNENLPGIPRAPVVRFMNESQYNYERAKERLGRRLPLLQADDILRHRKPYIFLIKQLLSEGYHQFVEEILDIKQLEQEEVAACRRQKAVFVQDMHLVRRAVDSFKVCFEEEIRGKYLKAANARFAFAEELLRKGDLWLARYFILTAVRVAGREDSEESCEFQSKMHCILAFLGRHIFDHIQDQVQATIEHLELSRALSRNKKWIFRVPLIRVSLRKPVHIYGLRNELEQIYCNSLPVYKLTTLIYFDILMQMVTHTMTNVRRASTVDEYGIAFKLTQEALALAKEIRHPLAEMSALTEYGILLRGSQSYDEAIRVFQQLTHESMVHGDHDAQAIALGNIGACLHGQGMPSESLKWLVTQNELSHEKHLKELEADSMEKLGYVLLEEGHVHEAEQAIYEAFLKYSVSELTQTNQRSVNPDHVSKTPQNEETQSKPKSRGKPVSTKDAPASHLPKIEVLTDAAWAYAGIAAGQGQWARLAGHCRQGPSNIKALEAVLDWKHHRCLMEPVPSTPSSPLQLQRVYEELSSGNKVPPPETCDLACVNERYHFLFRRFTQFGSPPSPSKQSGSSSLGTPGRVKSVKMSEGLQVWSFMADDTWATPDRASKSARSPSVIGNSPQGGSSATSTRSVKTQVAFSTKLAKSSQKRIMSYASSYANYDIIVGEGGEQKLVASRSAKDLWAGVSLKLLRRESIGANAKSFQSITSKGPPPDVNLG